MGEKLGLKDFFRSLKKPSKEDVAPLKEMLFPNKKKREQFWMMIVAMFIAVYARDLFEFVSDELKKNYEPWYTEAIITILIFLFLYVIFIILYYTGMALVYLGEVYVIRTKTLSSKEDKSDESETEEESNNKEVEKNSMKSDSSKLKNPFLWLSILLLIMGMTGTYYSINKIYESTFPYTHSRTVGNQYEIYVSCISLEGYEVPVSGDFFSCNATTIDLNITDGLHVKDTAAHVKAVTLRYPKSDFQETSEYEFVGHGYKKGNETSSGIIDIRVPIEEGINEFSLELFFPYVDEENETMNYYYHTGFIDYQGINLKEYQRRQIEKFSLMFTMLAFFIMFSFTGVRNLMAIWDRKIE
jgi:Ca2+/Na+ antiporter